MAVATAMKHSSSGSSSESASDSAVHLATRAGMMAPRCAGSPSARPTASASVDRASYSMRTLRRPYTSIASASVSSTACDKTVEKSNHLLA